MEPVNKNENRVGWMPQLLQPIAENIWLFRLLGFTPMILLPPFVVWLCQKAKERIKQVLFC